ncbi:uncharacterized protein LOC106652537 isoform X1 [Trichogramma pretiosum]|uniref:uncharacterized protein LOC106652537 isoform X1 n=2 Tax=Trichogramma pretiosum TaxID=7493 RepID=UPI0006C9DAD7|nr:uncharacterized protein LOC106652537 isoform X1 [Trichogramma pretiosum]
MFEKSNQGNLSLVGTQLTMSSSDKENIDTWNLSAELNTSNKSIDDEKDESTSELRVYFRSRMIEALMENIQSSKCSIDLKKRLLNSASEVAKNFEFQAFDSSKKLIKYKYLVAEKLTDIKKATKNNILSELFDEDSENIPNVKEFIPNTNFDESTTKEKAESSTSEYDLIKPSYSNLVNYLDKLTVASKLVNYDDEVETQGTVYYSQETVYETPPSDFNDKYLESLQKNINSSVKSKRIIIQNDTFKKFDHSKREHSISNVLDEEVLMKKSKLEGSNESIFDEFEFSETKSINSRVEQDSGDNDTKYNSFEFDENFHYITDLDSPKQNTEIEVSYFADPGMGHLNFDVKSAETEKFDKIYVDENGEFLFDEYVDHKDSYTPSNEEKEEQIHDILKPIVDYYRSTLLLKNDEDYKRVSSNILADLMKRKINNSSFVDNVQKYAVFAISSYKYI